MTDRKSPTTTFIMSEETDMRIFPVNSALFTFADGRYCGANLDRNGLRPCRWVTTNDDRMICASEVGTIQIEPEKITRKGRLMPGKMLLVDTVEGRIVDDKELKHNTSRRQPFANWIASQLLRLPEIMEKEIARGDVLAVELDNTTVSTDPRLLAAGYTFEQLDLLLRPLVNGQFPLFLPSPPRPLTDNPTFTICRG